MTIRNALASLAVRDIASARDWYQKLLGQKGSIPMPEVVEWTFPGGWWPAGLRVGPARRPRLMHAGGRGH